MTGRCLMRIVRLKQRFGYFVDFFPQVFPYNINVFIQQAHAHSLANIEKTLINKHLVSCHLLMGKKKRERAIILPIHHAYLFLTSLLSSPWYSSFISRYFEEKKNSHCFLVYPDSLE